MRAVYAHGGGIGHAVPVHDPVLDVGEVLGVVMLPGASRLGDADPSGPDRLVALPPASLDVRRR